MACERLDAHDLLRDYIVRNARKTYAENDYYDSDEDTFYDRTGQVEEQRRKRRLRYEVCSHCTLTLCPIELLENVRQPGADRYV